MGCPVRVTNTELVTIPYCRQHLANTRHNLRVRKTMPPFPSPFQSGPSSVQGLNSGKLQLRHPDPRIGQCFHEVVAPPVAGFL